MGPERPLWVAFPRPGSPVHLTVVISQSENHSVLFQMFFLAAQMLTAIRSIHESFLHHPRRHLKSTEGPPQLTSLTLW